MEDATQTLDAPEPLQRVQSLFGGKERELGTPDEPTKAGFLALASAGKDIWNAWREAWPGPLPDFRSADFRETEADFSGFQFAPTTMQWKHLIHLVRFDDAQFGDFVMFTGARFGNRACFAGARFGFSANFSEAQFGDGAVFSGVQFGDGAVFSGAQFGDGAVFSGVEFGNVTWFTGTQFGDEADFSRAKFGHRADFSGAQFGAGTRFSVAEIGAGASFDAVSIANLKVTLERLDISRDAVHRLMSKVEATSLSPDAFLAISFDGTHFVGDVSFRNRIFKGATTFGSLVDHHETKGLDDKRKTIRVDSKARFGGIPIFHGCTLNQDTSFDDAEFRAPPSADAARAYRTLRLAFAQQQAIREEQRFFRCEMEAEAGIASGARRIMFLLYGKLANYGFSFRRPLCFWLLSTGVCGLFYGLIAGPYPSFATGVDWSRTAEWAQFTVINAVPLPGFDRTLTELREALFGPRETTLLAAAVIELLHKAVSLLALFLTGLALRNLFKLKA